MCRRLGGRSGSRNTVRTLRGTSPNFYGLITGDFIQTRKMMGVK